MAMTLKSLVLATQNTRREHHTSYLARALDQGERVDRDVLDQGERRLIGDHDASCGALVG
jgi:hypothetical protein